MLLQWCYGTLTKIQITDVENDPKFLTVTKLSIFSIYINLYIFSILSELLTLFVVRFAKEQTDV